MDGNDIALGIPIPVLDHGYVRFVEDWGRGDANVAEAGIIEAARQSTQASFRGWEASIAEPREACPYCAGLGNLDDRLCPRCDGDGLKRAPGDKALLRTLYMSRPQHATPFEFAGLVIEVQAPIFVFREWHRHRTQSYNEMSARYAPLPSLDYVPTIERIMLDHDKKLRNKQASRMDGAPELTIEAAEAFRRSLIVAYGQADELYRNALGSGVPKEVARAILPVGRYSRMRASANLRNWLAFMTLRADPAAQWEIQQFAHAVGRVLDARFPQTLNLFHEAAAQTA